MDEDYEEDGPGYRDFPGDNDGDPAFCDEYVVHEPHVYRALNGTNYRCCGLDAEAMAALEAEAARPPCEHGLSAALCAGPGHYPPD